MRHEVFELSHWQERFALDRLRNEASTHLEVRRYTHLGEFASKHMREEQVRAFAPGGERITGPYDLAVTEQIRAEALTAEERERGVPTDVFIFCQGEPEDRAVTKIGGLPYRSARQAWPHDNDRAPLTFVAQICFVDSLDLVGSLPGDVLLIFARQTSVYQEQRDALHFEWVRLGESDLVAAPELPNTDWLLTPCYGQIHRTHDYPAASNSFQRYRASYLLHVLEGTKIGGLPRWIQYPAPLDGRFLAAVGSIDVQPYATRPYPLVNVPEPISAANDQHYLTWGDVGSLYLFLAADGQIGWVCQYY